MAGSRLRDPVFWLLGRVTQPKPTFLTVPVQTKEALHLPVRVVWGGAGSGQGHHHDAQLSALDRTVQGQLKKNDFFLLVKI